MIANTCVCCGAVIPEGRQVCPICEAKIVEKMGQIRPKIMSDEELEEAGFEL